MSLSYFAQLAAVAIGFALCPSLQAVTFSYDFTSSTSLSSFTTSTSSGSTGNSLQFTPAGGGPTVKATAWYLDASGVFQQAALGIYANGLGVCYPGENCTDSNYQIDGSVYREFILLESSTLIDPFTARITNSSGSSSDSDTTYWLGGFNGGTQSLNLTGATVSSLTALGFGSRNNNNTGQDLCNGCFRNMSLAPTNTGVTKLLFGAALSGNGGPDYFLFTSLGANSVPEPSSVVLLATAAIAFFTLARRSRKVAH